MPKREGRVERVSLQREMRHEAGRLRNGLERDAPATFLVAAHEENTAYPWKQTTAPAY